jgi:hypothetical protein
MFVHDAPSAVDFAQAHCQPKFQGFPLAKRINVDAPSHGGSERNVQATGDPDIVKSKGNGFFRRREKGFPSRHIGAQPLRLKRRRHIEHQNAGVVVGANSRTVFVPHRSSPSLDKSVNFRFVVHDHTLPGPASRQGSLTLRFGPGYEHRKRCYRPSPGYFGGYCSFATKSSRPFGVRSRKFQIGFRRSRPRSLISGDIRGCAV